MTNEELIEYLTGIEIVILPEQLGLVWPQYEDGDFVEPDLVGPRPARPPHKPPVKVPEIDPNVYPIEN